MKWKKKVISKPLMTFFSKKEDVTVDDVRDIWYVERSNNILAVDYFLSYFIRIVVKKKKLKSLMFFLLYCNDNNYMTYCWPNSAFFNFQSLLIKGIADNILAFFFWQIGTNGDTCKKATHLSIYISLYMNTLLKTGVCMIKVIYLHVLSGWWYSRVCTFLICQSNDVKSFSLSNKLLNFLTYYG